MSDLAIQVDNISKQYLIGAARPSYDTLREVIVQAVYRGLRRNDEASRVFWALKQVSFEIKQGEVIGIIGPNGAGKSTLLKILSRITEPTTGHAQIHGRMSSLLEVGTGFHPELTGRENIYLNGAILGMKKTEIAAQFDEIVAFAETEKFLDTQVKHYSSGMYVRLAFAVAAHLQSEILILDEVLAVGDAAFQRKCLGKMEQTAKGGRTVLFVSHNMFAIQSMCTKSIVLKGGSVVFSGTTPEAIRHYLESVKDLQKQSLDTRQDRKGGTQFRFINLEFLQPENLMPVGLVMSGQTLLVSIGYRNATGTALSDVGIGIAFYTQVGALMFSCRSRAVGASLTIPPGEGRTVCRFDRFPLKEGIYSINLFAERRDFALDDVRTVCELKVEAGDYYGSGCLPAPGQPAVLVDYSWE